MTKDIISERRHMNSEAMTDVSEKWGWSQEVNGPILVIPVDYLVTEKKEDKTETRLETRHFTVLPEQLIIDGDVTTKKLERGIYEVVVYKSVLDISGTFIVNPEFDSANLNRIRYNDAFLTMGISDLRGIENSLDFNWNKSRQEVSPGSKIPETIASGVTIPAPGIEKMTGKVIPFSMKLHLQGSKNLRFVPLGKTTRVSLKSDWSAPKFNGNFLPDNRDLPETGGFSADWQVLQLNRNYPQSWIGSMEGKKLKSSSFGVDLIIPLDDYQKATRSAKYGAMTIALTFLVFFLAEILNKRRIHPFQYALVGLALCLFYILLVSLSEYMAFNTAYMLATLSVVLMISLYSLSVFKANKLSMILAVTLTGIYGFMFVTLQLADYALLMGSVGLTLILALTMYFTRNINWYNLNIARG